MGKTVLQLIQRACYEGHLTNVPSALSSATDSDAIQLLHLFYATGRDLRSARVWPQLKRFHFVELEAGRTQYPLPEDYYSALPQTHWDMANSWSMNGPLSDSQWQGQTLGYVALENQKGYRVFGPDINSSDSRGQLLISPTPGDGDAGTYLYFEYVSKSWIIPPLWSASEASVAQDTYRFCSGNIYKKTDVGSQNGSTIPPNMARGIGQDGGVWWRYISASAWSSSTAYAVGTYVTNGGNLYQCKESGTSASSGGPTGTSTDAEVTDGTVSWQYYASSTWTAYTEYVEGDHVVKGSNRYRCVRGPFSPGSLKSGANGPDWTATTVPDGNITWTYQTAAYEEIVTDSDLCLFDDELMIAGLKYYFLEARSLESNAARMHYERLKSRAVGRWNPGQILSLAGRSDRRSPNIPDGGWNI